MAVNFFWASVRLPPDGRARGADRTCRWLSWSPGRPLQPRIGQRFGPVPEVVAEVIGAGAVQDFRHFICRYHRTEMAVSLGCKCALWEELEGGKRKSHSARKRVR